MSITKKSVHLKNILEQIQKNATNSLWLPINKEEAEALDAEAVQKIIKMIFENKKINQFYFQGVPLWNFSEKELLEIVNLINENLARHPSANSYFLSLWSVFDPIFKSAAEGWNYETKYRCAKKLMSALGNIKCYLNLSWNGEIFPFSLKIKDYIELFSSFFTTAKSMSFVTQKMSDFAIFIKNCALEKEEQENREELERWFEEFLLERALKKFESNSTNPHPNFNMNTHTLTPTNIKKIAASIASSKQSHQFMNLNFKINLKKDEKTIFESIALLFNTLPKYVFGIDVAFEPKETLTLSHIQKLVGALSPNHFYRYLNFGQTNLWQENVKTIQELIESIESSIEIETISLWSDLNKNLGKEWDETQKKDYLEKVLIHARVGFDGVLHVPFDLNFESYQKLIREFLLTNPKLTRKVMNWLYNTKFNLTEAEIGALTLEVQAAAASDENAHELHLNPHVKKNRLTQLSLQIRQNCFPNLYSCKVSISSLTEKEMKQIIEFMNETLPMSRIASLLIEETGSLEKDLLPKIIQFLKNVKNTIIGQVTLRMKLGDFEVEALAQFFGALNKIDWIKSFDLSHCGLNTIPDKNIISLFKILIQDKQINYLTISDNNILKRDLKVVSELIDLLLAEKKLGYIAPWYGHEISANQYSKEERELLVKIMMKLEPRYPSFGEQPFAGLLEPEQEFESVCQLIKDNCNTVFWKLSNWLEKTKYSDEQRLTLAKLCAQHANDALRLVPFKLNPKDTLAFYLSDCEKFGDRALLNIKRNYALHETDLSVSPMLTIWNGFLDLEEAQEETKLLKLKDEMIEGLKKASALLFGNEKFFEPVLHKIVQSQFSMVDEHELTKWFSLVQWYTWLSISLYQEDLKNHNPGILAKPLKEIVDLAEPSIRYKAARLLMSITVNPEKRKIYEEFIKTNRALTFVPAIYLTEIITADIKNTKIIKEYKETKELRESVSSTHVKLAVEILNALSGDYNQGHYARAFIGALQALTAIKDLTSHQKLILIKNLSRESHHYQPIEKDLNLYFKTIKSKLKSLPSQEIKKTIEDKIGGQANKIFSVLPEKYQQHLTKNETFEHRDFNAFSRSIITAFLKINHDLVLNEQMTTWYLIQGLSLLGELSDLVHISPDKYKQAIVTILKRVFSLTDDHMRYYDVSFSGRRNEMGLFTYLGNIRTLKTEEQPILEKQICDFVQSVLTKENREFYKNRYSVEKSAHLKRVFDVNPRAALLWKQNQSADFNEFFQEHQITIKNTEINFEQFLHQRIFEHRHYPVEKCQDLKLYLEGKGLKDKEEIKSRIKNKISALPDAQLKKAKKESKETLENEILENKLQLQLIELIEIDPKNKEEQKRSIQQICKTLRAQLRRYEFSNDLEGILTIFNHSNRPFDLKNTVGWKIVFTDDFWLLFMCGTDVAGSCQRINGDPHLNKCLLAYILDGKNKLVAILDDKNKIVARAIIRILLDEVDKKVTFFVEEMYPYSLMPVYRLSLEKWIELLSEDFMLKAAYSEKTIDFRPYPNPLHSLSGIGSEYVDALHQSVPEGRFSLPMSQILYSPFQTYQAFLKTLFCLGPNKLEHKGIQALLDVVFEYANLEEDFAQQNRPLHFKWNINRAEETEKVNALTLTSQRL